jgi:hypothetical protein
VRRLGVLMLALPATVAAQGLRLSGVTTVQVIELRPFVIDSALASSLPGSGDWRTAPGGVPAICSSGSLYCRFERSGGQVSAMPLLQDLTLTGWGWREGLSFHADLRARSQIGGGSDFTWPRANDHIDLVDAYAELERDAWRGRLGRQWINGGLGSYDYDGADLLVRREALSVEGWGGRALLAGLDEPYRSAQLAAIDNLPPVENGYIFGVRARYRPDATGSASLLYQRVILADRSGFYSERVAFDASARRLAARMDLGLAYDLATGQWNEARLRVGTAGLGTLGASVEARQSRPFFELWTIWGAFAPVGFNEASATLDWRPHQAPITVAVHGAYRTYQNTQAGFELRTNGWRAGGDAIWTASSALSVSGSYDVDIGSGAAGSDGSIGARWSRANGLMLGASGSVTQNIYEFRIGTGRIYGAQMSGAVPITSDARFAVDAGWYRHVLTNGAAGPDWSQRRLTARFEWTVGRDPGMGAGRQP